MTTSRDDEQLLDRALELLHARYEANAHFNRHLDDREEKAAIAGESYACSKALFWTDPIRYEEERAEWESQTIARRHEAVTSLLRDNGCATAFSDLLAAVERGRVVPFVGAGLSRPVGLPLWGDALKELLARLLGMDASRVTHIRTMIKDGLYLEAAQALAVYDRVQTANFIRTRYRAQSYNLTGPILALPRFAKGCIVTTNFDDAIEKTYEREHVEFTAYMHGTQDHNFFQRLVRGDRCLLKLHGDAENDATYVLTAAEYEAAYGQPPAFDFGKPLPKALRQIYVSQTLLFLGCSLEQDWTMRLFAAAKADSGFHVPTHYAVLPEPDLPQIKQQKESQLLALSVQPVWYPTGRHETVQHLLDLLVDVAEKRARFTP